jgi:hypothetical protein
VGVGQVSSALLVHGEAGDGQVEEEWQRSFQPSMKVPIAVMSCLMLSTDPRRMAGLLRDLAVVRKAASVADPDSPN